MDNSLCLKERERSWSLPNVEETAINVFPGLLFIVIPSLSEIGQKLIMLSLRKATEGLYLQVLNETLLGLSLTTIVK